MATSINLWTYLAQFLLEWNMFQTKIVENQNTFYVMYLFILFSKIVPFMR